jgi:hypothetical protein
MRGALGWGRSARGTGRGAAWAAGGLVIGLAVVFVVLVKVRPAYDAYGWLVWGRQAAHLRLDTSAAPSWKPLTFLFTLPYAMAFGRWAVWLWMVTATAAGFAAPAFAGRIAWRLSGDEQTPPPARLLGGVLAGAAVLGIEGYWHFLLIATADPMVVGLVLAAVDCALADRRRGSWILLVLVCLGRPEALPVLLVLAALEWRRTPRLRPLLIAGIAVIPLLWFGIPALTSPSWFNAGKVLDESTTALSGNKLMAILDGFLSLYELPMRLLVLLALGLAVVQRRRAWLLMIGAAVLWLLCDLALALHGDGVAPRYMFEPAAVLVVLAGAAIGRLLAGELVLGRVVRLGGVAILAALAVTFAQPIRLRARLVHNGIELGHTWARQIHRLRDVIAADGGAARIMACGQPVVPIAFQSILAWELDRNVAQVGWEPDVALRSRDPVVLFTPWHAGWIVRAVHPARGQFAACRRLDRTTATG